MFALLEVLALVVSFLFAPSHGEALRATAPHYLTVETASSHLAAATVAGVVTDIDPALLLAIARGWGARM